tara:strand:+ start:6028 stop:6426 length:399 start_codon:yes stop_codon:yes gene_type:complete
MSQLSFDQFIKVQEKASKRLIDDLKKILEASALKMERSAKVNATSFPKVRTGRLRSSIHGLIDAPLATPRIILRAGGQSGGSDVRYAKFQEFGTDNIQPPRLFLGRAVAKEKDNLPDKLRSLLSVAFGVSDA